MDMSGYKVLAAGGCVRMGGGWRGHHMNTRAPYEHEGG